MNNFKEIQSIWDSQEKHIQSEVPVELYDRINKSNRVINNKHIKTIIVLLMVMIAIGVGFGYIIKLQTTLASIGLAVMEIVLLTRILIECYSYFRKRKLDVTEQTKILQRDLCNYYKWRKSIHGFKTLLLLVLYIIGVAMMFSEFKYSLSSFWFTFFVIEFIVLAIVLTYLIGKQVKKEIIELDELIEIYSV